MLKKNKRFHRKEENVMVMGFKEAGIKESTLLIIISILQKAFGKAHEIKAIVRDHTRGTEGRDGFRLIDHSCDQASNTVGLMVQNGKAQCFHISVCVPEGFDKEGVVSNLKNAIDQDKERIQINEYRNNAHQVFNGINIDIDPSPEQNPESRPEALNGDTQTSLPQVTDTQSHVPGIFKDFFADPGTRNEIKNKISNISNSDGTLSKKSLLKLIMEIFDISYLETGPVFRSLVSDKDGVPILDVYQDPNTNGKSYRLHQDKIVSPKPEDRVSEEKHSKNNQQSLTPRLSSSSIINTVSSESLSCHLRLVADLVKSFKSPSEYETIETQLKEALVKIATLENQVAELEKKLLEIPKDDHDRAQRAEEALDKIKQALGI